MARTNHAGGKRAREAEKARKKKDKAERKRRNKESGIGGIPVVTADEIQVIDDSAHDPFALPGQQSSRTAGPPVKLFVGGLTYDADEEMLRKLFGAHGEVNDVAIILDRNTGEPRGIAFVTMSDRRSAQKAIKELNGYEMEGRTLRVDLSIERRR